MKRLRNVEYLFVAGDRERRAGSAALAPTPGRRRAPTTAAQSTVDGQPLEIEIRGPDRSDAWLGSAPLVYFALGLLGRRPSPRVRC